MSAEPKSTLPALRRYQLPINHRRTFRTLAFVGRIKTIATSREDDEFLPAHLEILSRPVTPYALVLMWTLCLLIAAALVWSFLARLDIYAVASGRVQSSGRSKIVQPFETSKVRMIHARNGDKVRRGDLLIELDSTEADADLAIQESARDSLEIQMIRRATTIDAINSDELNQQPEFPARFPLAIRFREKAAMLAEFAQYRATLDSLKAQLLENSASQQKYSSSVTARERLITVLRERADMRETLVVRSAGTRASVIDALQQVEQVSADIASEKGQLAEAQAAATSLERKIQQLRSETIFKQAQALAEAGEKADSARQALVKANLRRDRMHVSAPIDGTVQQLAVTTIGQVVTAGQPLLVVVPSEGTTEIEALVLNKDIGFVTQGQEATVKIDSFPFTRYGMIEGRVVRVSRDAVDDHDAGGSTDTVSMARGQGIAPAEGTPRTQNLVFPVTVKVEKNNIESEGFPVELTPGMTAIVEIRTGSRRAIDYLLAPMRETTSTAGHER